MEEIKEESCSTSSKCCVKGIAVVVICSLICFFLGYYFGSKTTKSPSLHRRKVEYRDDLVPLFVKPRKGDDVLVPVVHDDPLEPVVAVVQLIQRLVVEIVGVEVLDVLL